MSKKVGPRSRADSALSNLVLEGGKSRTYKIARDAGNGQFITVKKAERVGDKAVVETIKQNKQGKG
jgi:hypothetical protein